MFPLSPFVAFAAAVLTAGLAFPPAPPVPALSPVHAGLPAPGNPGTMEVPTKILYHGDVLRLKFSTPHAGYLGIKDPGGHFFYLIFPASQAEGRLRPLMDSELFMKQAELALPTDRLTADPYRYGVYENQPVFTRSGTYTLIMGHNLAVDDPSELVVRQVEYRHEKRRQPARRPAADVAAL
jgi:hypothetical protein